jgi:hypothetical protein
MRLLEAAYPRKSPLGELAGLPSDPVVSERVLLLPRCPVGVLVAAVVVFEVVVVVLKVIVPGVKKGEGVRI